MSSSKFSDFEFKDTPSLSNTDSASTLLGTPVDLHFQRVTLISQSCDSSAVHKNQKKVLVFQKLQYRNLLGILHTAVSRVFAELCNNNNKKL